MDSFRPRCFTAEQWHEWVTYARVVRPNSRNDYCEDCTPLYKYEMLKQNRCSHPDVTFDVNNDEGMCGKRPHHTKE